MKKIKIKKEIIRLINNIHPIHLTTEIINKLKEEFEPKSNLADELKTKIDEWDELAKDNEDNKHNLSTSERQDWIDELNDINDEN